MHSDPVTHYGRLSDGKTASARDAGVRLDLSGLDIASADGTVRLRWPYETLRAGEPIRPHSVDVLLSSPAGPGVSLFVPDPAFVKALCQRAPQLTARAERWRHARPWVVGAAVVSGAFALIHALGWTPMRSVARLLPESWRDRLGEAAIESMVENRKRCKDSAGAAALTELSTRLTRAAGHGAAFKVTVIDWDLLNAFAVPGNQIIMTKGLIEKAGSADEVAGVLAHEMGHGIELHPETGIIRAVGLAAALELMMGGSSGTLGNMGLMLAQIGYTRAAEREADIQALELLRKAEISLAGLGKFFNRVLSDEDGDDGAASEGGANKDKGSSDTRSQSKNSKSLKRALDMFSTHPPTAERAEMIRMSAKYPATPALTGLQWDALRKICSVTEPLVPPGGEP